MPSIEENRSLWSDYNWHSCGDEWSRTWGGSEQLWHQSILPRIARFVPTGHIVEIAPGYGRCSERLKNLCETLTLVDLNQVCIDACKKRFANESHIGYFVNDGKSLGFLEDKSVDFIFSWDSLVHAEQDAMAGYLREIDRVLKVGGSAFVHHSNMRATHIPGEPDLEYESIRAKDVSAEWVLKQCEELNTTCLSQELIIWSSKVFTDCISLFYKPKHDEHIESKLLINPYFIEQASYAGVLAQMYNPSKAQRGRFYQPFSEVVSSIKKANKRRPIYIWGAGKNGRESMHFVQDLGIKIDGFLDDSAIEGDTRYGYRIAHPSVVVKKIEKSGIAPFFILSFQQNITKVCSLLLKKGYREWIDFIDFSSFPEELSENVHPSFKNNGDEIEHLKKTVAKNTPHKELIATKGMDFCLEGFPRSGNSYFGMLLQEVFFLSTGSKPRYSHHLHDKNNVRLAVLLDLPTIVLYRNPKDALLSYYLYREEKDSLNKMALEYLKFYETVLGLMPECYLVDFEMIIKTPKTILEELSSWRLKLLNPALCTKTLESDTAQKVRDYVNQNASATGNPETIKLRMPLPVAERKSHIDLELMYLADSAIKRFALDDLYEELYEARVKQIKIK